MAANSKQEGDILSIPMEHSERSAYLPQLFLDLVSRLQRPLPLGTRALVSHSSAKRGILRREPGPAPVLVKKAIESTSPSVFAEKVDSVSSSEQRSK